MLRNAIFRVQYDNRHQRINHKIQSELQKAIAITQFIQGAATTQVTKEQKAKRVSKRFNDS
jgi:hypothetical protein